MTDPVEPTDIELLRRADSGQSHHFGALFDRHHVRVLNTCYRLLGNREDAEDAAALVFLECWRRRTAVRDVDGSLLPWLLTTAVNVGRTYRRSRGRYYRFRSALRPDTDHKAATDEVEQRLERLASRGPTWAAFAKLSEREQTVLLLCVVEDLPQEEVARTLGLALGTVKSRLSRAKERLRRQLETDRSLAAQRLGAAREGGR